MYAWMVVVASASIKLISQVISWAALPILVNFWIKSGMTTTDIAWITTVLNFMAYCTAPLCNWIVRSTRLWQSQLIAVISCTVGITCTAYATTTWQIVIAFSILNGFGISLSFITSITAVKRYSGNRRANAYPVIWVGDSVGSMAGPLIVHALLVTLGRQGLLFLAAGESVLGGATVVIYMDLCSRQEEVIDEETRETNPQESNQDERQPLLTPVGDVMCINADTEDGEVIPPERRDITPEMTSGESTTKQQSNSELISYKITRFNTKLINALKQTILPMKDPIFLLILFYFLLAGFAITTYNSYNVWYAVHTGIPELEAAVGPTIKGAASLLATILISVFGQFIKQPIIFHIVMAILNGSAILSFGFLNGLAMFYALSLLCFAAAAVSANLMNLVQTFGDEHLATRMALCYTAKGLGYMIGSVIAAALIGAFGANFTFLIGGVVYLVGCLLVIPMLYKYVLHNLLRGG